MDSLLTLIIFLVLTGVVAIPYWRKALRARKEAEALKARSEKTGLTEPVTLHPKIDVLSCIGCGSCVRICPENVLGLVDGRAAIVNGIRCIGHALCADVCPVGAITMGFGKPREGMDLPVYDDHLMTNVRNLYIAGELGGIGLIRNAIGQGVRTIEHIAQNRRHQNGDGLDAVIVGAGPAGIGAALAASERGIRYAVLEQEDLGGSILHYPRQKLVLTTPVDIPLYGRLKLTEVGKEELLSLFESFVSRYNLAVRTHQKVEAVEQSGEGFIVRTQSSSYTAPNVILAIGRRGSPRKLGIPGEALPKVTYRLIEAERYKGKHVLVVGGGDSAVEAAVALARQNGNTVTLSYRRDSFVRLKEKNEKNIGQMSKDGSVRVIFNSEVEGITPTEAVLRCSGGSGTTIPNDFVFIFAGGELPFEFLKKAGVRMRSEEAG